MDQTRRAAVWSRYWQGGAAHSCPGSVPERLGGALAAFWSGLAARVPAQGRVLEIGAGNGAVSRLVLEERSAASVALDAVDLARLRPVWLSALPAEQAARVIFHEGTPAERLPFEGERFDLVAGQFAFEYMDRDAVLAELARVSRPGAHLALVLHHAGSELVRVAAEEQRHLEQLLRANGLLDTVGALLPDLARTRTPEGVAQLRRDATAEARRQRYNALQLELETLASRSAAPDVLNEGAAAAAGLVELAARAGEAAAAPRLQLLRQGFQDAKVRLDELLNCALDAQALGQLVAALTARGYASPDTGTVEQDGHLIGWTLVARRSA